MPCSCPLVHKDFRKYSNREPRAPKKSLHYSGSPQRHLPDPIRPAIPCLPRPHRSSIVLAYGLTECRSSGLTAGPSLLAQSHRQKFLEGRGAGRENLFPKRFPSPQAFLSSHLQASACRPCRTMFFLRGDSLARSPTRHCSPAGERVSGTGTNIDDNSARPFPKTKKSPAERG